jgi:hypothetical protein
MGYAIDEFEEFKNALKEILENSTSLDDLISKAMVGECPNCGSEETTDCEEVSEIDSKIVADNTIGICRQCGHLWCIECGFPLTSSIRCKHWGICGSCEEEKDESGMCEIPAFECQQIKKGFASENGGKKDIS